MEEITYRKYGGPDVVTLANVPKPILKPDDILICIFATTVARQVVRKLRNSGLVVRKSV